MYTDIERYCSEISEIVRTIPARTLTDVAIRLLACWRAGGTIFVIGNGGSAATASHLACDLAKGTRTEGLPAFRVLPLTDCTPLLTAWANDTSYEQVFAEQVAALVRPEDLVIALSVSGNSPNIVAAAQTTRQIGATLIVWTGRTGGQLQALADLAVHVPSDSVEQVEDLHLMIAHSVCVALRARLHAEAALRETSPTLRLVAAASQ